MIIYITMLGVSILFSYISTKYDKIPKNIFRILSVIPFIIVSGFRYKVGTDYLFRYVPDYLIIFEGGDVPNLEIITKIIIKFCCFITRDYCLFFFITSLMINVLVFFAIYKYSKRPILSILVYFIGSSFFLSMNLVRQYISSAILLIAVIEYLNDRKKIKYIVLVAIAAGFHTFALFMAPIIFLNKKKYNDIILIILCIVIAIFGEQITNFVLKLFSIFKFINLSKYSIYSGNKRNLPFSSLIVETAIYLYFSYVYKKNYSLLSNKDKEISTVFINLQWLMILFVVACSANDLFIRVTSALMIFQIISISYFYDLGIKNLKDKDNWKYSFIILILIIILMGMSLIYSFVIRGSADVLPYRSIFERSQNIYSEMNYIEFLYNRR